MTTEIIISAHATAEYIKKYSKSENLQTIQMLAALINDTQSDISLNAEEIHLAIDSNEEDRIAFFLILDPLGIGTEFTANQIQDIIKKLHAQNSKNALFLILTNAFTEMSSNTQEIIRLADHLIFLKDSDYNATKSILKPEQKSTIINTPSSLDDDDISIDDRESDVLVNGDILQTSAIQNLCTLANVLKNKQSSQSIHCYIDDPFRRENTALVELLKAVYPRLNSELNKKLLLDPNVSAKQLLAWFDELDDTLIGPRELPIYLNFDRQDMVSLILGKCTYAYDPLHSEVDTSSCRINGLLASELLLLTGDPNIAADNIVFFEGNDEALKDALQEQIRKYSEYYSNKKISETVLKCIVDIMGYEDSTVHDAYLNVNLNFWYDEEYLWKVILAKAASINLHLADEDNGGLILGHDGKPFVLDSKNFTVTKPVQIGGQAAAIQSQLERLKTAINTGLSKNHLVLTPLFKQAIQHWCLALIKIQDSEAQMTIIETVDNYTDEQLRTSIQAIFPADIKITGYVNIAPKMQTDGASCGPLAIKHIFDFIQPSNSYYHAATTYKMSEVLALRKEHIELLDDEVLIERQKQNVAPAAEPKKAKVSFDLDATQQLWHNLASKRNDHDHEDVLNELTELCHEFLLGEIDPFSGMDGKSKIKGWFVENAAALGCQPLFDLFFEYKNSEPVWKNNGVDDLVALLRRVSGIEEHESKILRFSAANQSREETATGTYKNQKPNLRQGN
jgi:hypothetical protein